MKLSYHDLEQSKSIFSKELKKWYSKSQRKLPWRCNIKDNNYPYKILVSEFMLQQTAVNTVVPYFLRFIKKWSSITSLAQASEEEVLNYWQGLGYYSRGRNLLKTAKIIDKEFNGIVPDALENLLTLPGIGEYASAAIRSIAYNKKATVVDGNVKRVIARFFALKGELKDNEKNISYLASFLTPNRGNSNYSQAIMEFGALVCKPKQSNCNQCVFNNDCLSLKKGLVLKIPKPKMKINKKDLKCLSFLVIKNDLILIEKRNNQNLLRDMWQLPSSNWVKKNSNEKLLSQAPFKAEWMKSDKKINHKFSHINLLNETYITKVNSKIDLNSVNYKWVNKNSIKKLPIVTLTKKILADNNLI